MDAAAPVDDVVLDGDAVVPGDVDEVVTTTKTKERISAFYIHLLPYIVCRKGQDGAITKKESRPIRTAQTILFSCTVQYGC